MRSKAVSPVPAAAPVQTGDICLDILNNAWSPAWTLHSVCQVGRGTALAVSQQPETSPAKRTARRG